MSYGELEPCLCGKPFGTGDSIRFVRLHAETLMICRECFTAIEEVLRQRKAVTTAARETTPQSIRF